MLTPIFRILLISIVTLLLFSGCTVSRITAFFMPSVTDYKVFPCDSVACSSLPAAKAFETAVAGSLPDLKDWIPFEYRREAKSLDSFMLATQTTSFLVVRNDSLLFENYYNGHHEEAPQVVFSVTKAITAMLAAIAMQEGLLNSNQAVADFIPEFGLDARRDIKIDNLLNMTSGLNFSDKGNIARLSLLYYNNNQEKYVKNFKRVLTPPGTKFSYKSIETQILAMCIEKATGKKLQDYLFEKLWNPLGMEFPALYTLDSKKTANARAFGGIAMSSRDMLRLGKLMLQKGSWNGEQLVPEYFFQDVANRNMNDETFWGYSNCFWRDGYLEQDFLEQKDFFAAGFHGQFIYVHPEKNIIIVRQGIKESIRWPLVFGRLAAVLSGEPNDLTDACLNYDDQFDGIYESPLGERYEIVYKGRDLEGQKTWIVRKDINQTLKSKKVLEMKRSDGRSMAYRRFAFQVRAIFKIEDDRVVGMYYDNQRGLDTKYFVKKGTISLAQRKNILAQYK